LPSNVVSLVTRRAWMERAHARRDTEVFGVLSAGTVAISCLVEDISVGGARVCAENSVVIGDFLRLSVPELNFTAQVKVVWVTTEAAGVSFLGC
jgi:hypothetical protein